MSPSSAAWLALVLATWSLGSCIGARPEFLEPQPNLSRGVWTLRSPEYRQVYSRGGQDGVLEYIFHHIGVTNKYFADLRFGADSYWDTTATVKHLWTQYGWDGVLFDPYKHNAGINLHAANVTTDNVAALLHAHRVFPEADYVEIDVGRDNLWIFEALVKSSYFRPRVVAVGYSCGFPLSAPMARPRTDAEANLTDAERDAPLASIGAIHAAGLAHGYSVLAVVDAQDVFLVRSDLLGGHPAPPLGAFGRYTGCREGDKLRKYHYVPTTGDGGAGPVAGWQTSFEQALAAAAGGGDATAMDLLRLWEQRSTHGDRGAGLPLASSAAADRAYAALMQTWGREAEAEPQHPARARRRGEAGGISVRLAGEPVLPSSPHGDPALEALFREWGRPGPRAAHAAVQLRTGAGRRGRVTGTLKRPAAEDIAEDAAEEAPEFEGEPSPAPDAPLMDKLRFMLRAWARAFAGPESMADPEEEPAWWPTHPEPEMQELTWGALQGLMAESAQEATAAGTNINAARSAIATQLQSFAAQMQAAAGLPADEVVTFPTEAVRRMLEQAGKLAVAQGSGLAESEGEQTGLLVHRF